MKKIYRYSIFYRILSNTFFTIVLLLDLYFIVAISTAAVKGLFIIKPENMHFILLLLLLFVIPVAVMSSYPNIMINNGVLYYKSIIGWKAIDIAGIVSYKTINTIVHVGIPHKGEILILKLRHKYIPKYLFITNSIKSYDELKQFIGQQFITR